MRGWRGIVFVLTLLLAGCQPVPGVDELRHAVESRLAGALPPNTIVISELKRRGAQRDAEAPAGTKRRVVYFDVELCLVRDYDFGAWDEPGIAGLVSALGAGPRGLQGIVNGGNRAGDIVLAHGTLLYQFEDGHWVAVEPGGFEPTRAPAPGGASESLFTALREIVARVPPEAAPALRSVIEQELQQAYTSVNARIARAERGYAIAAGPEGGQYLRLVQALAADTATRLVPIVTGGGEENLRLLRSGAVDFALSQGDAVLAAYRGEAIFADDGPFAALRAVGSLYPEVVHVIVRQDSGIEGPGALGGKRVAIGVPGSATRATALAVLATHHLPSGAFESHELPLGAALVALREGRVDAVISVVGLPADTIREAAASMPLRLLDLDATAVEALAANKAILPFEIPRGAYPDVDRPVRSVATPAVLLARAELSVAEVESVTRSVFGSGRDLVALGSAQGAQISAAHARLGIPVPQHAAALRVLDEFDPMPDGPEDGSGP